MSIGTHFDYSNHIVYVVFPVKKYTTKIQYWYYDYISTHTHCIKPL